MLQHALEPMAGLEPTAIEERDSEPSAERAEQPAQSSTESPSIMPKPLAPPPPAPDLMARLGSLVTDRGLRRLGRRLLELHDLVATDLIAIETALGKAGAGTTTSLAERGANHLLNLGGKRLRPLCVSLAARVGRGFDDDALHLAVAVELVHNATLLHDDVVDLADTRRGRRTARTEYGNAASIFAGDWLLIEALRRVRRTGADGVLDRLLDTIEEMILAESLQLENRGRIDTGRQAYFQVAEGKTAALFRWAMYAGGKAGGLAEAQCLQLENYGRHLGVAFQVIDDLLDLTGEPVETGKALFSDLREGKMTYPLIIALERDPHLRPAIEELLAAGPEGAPPQPLGERILAALKATGAVDDCRQLARQRSAQAIEAIETLPQGAASRALITVAEATVHRNR